MSSTNHPPNRASQTLARAKVKAVDWLRTGEYGKRLTLSLVGQNNAKVTIWVSRSACVTEGDIVYSRRPIDQNFSIEKDSLFIECHNGIAQICPIYSAQQALQIGSIRFPITVKEISCQDEHDGYIALSQYHYRDKILFGRHSPLVAVSDHPLLPKVIGYIDLSTAFFVNTPRRNMLDEPTSLNGVSWQAWTKDTARRRIPLFVRIARCVVHPEIRAIGLGKILVDHAAAFSKTHWQSAHWKPYFLEISADMLRFIPFAEKAGMIFVGETEGNLKRIAKDLKYLEANRNRLQKEIFRGEVVGILDTKLSQLQRATTIVNRSGERNIGTFITNEIRHPTLDGWAQLAGVLSLPKPHYMLGLNQEAMDLIAERAKSKKLLRDQREDPEQYINEMYRSRLQESVTIRDVSYQVDFSVRRSRVTHQIERSFEISLGILCQPVLKNVSLEISPGEIIVLTGLSGTGKSTIIQLLAGRLVATSGTISIPKEAKIGELSRLPTSKPLIEVISQGHVGRGIYWLGVVGLSEPFLFVKSFAALSAGQKYRAMLAGLLSQGSNLWLMDEFCENLDFINTQLVAQKISALAKEVGATVVIAASDATRFARSLRPDRVMILRGPIEKDGYNIISGKEFISSMTAHR